MTTTTKGSEGIGIADIGIAGIGGRLAGFFRGDVEVTGDIRLTGIGQDCAEDFDVAGIRAARQALGHHVHKLVLTPKGHPDGQVLEVFGDVDLFGGDERVMLVVAVDGIGLSGGIENTQVIDSAFGSKGRKGHNAGLAVQNRYKN